MEDALSLPLPDAGGPDIPQRVTYDSARSAASNGGAARVQG